MARATWPPRVRSACMIFDFPAYFANPLCDNAARVSSQVDLDFSSSQEVVQKSEIWWAGTCAGDVENFCTGVKPGEGRLAECLTKQQTEEEKGNVEGARSGTSRCGAHCARPGCLPDVSVTCRENAH